MQMAAFRYISKTHRCACPYISYIDIPIIIVMVVLHQRSFLTYCVKFLFPYPEAKIRGSRNHPQTTRCQANGPNNGAVVYIVQYLDAQYHSPSSSTQTLIVSSYAAADSNISLPSPNWFKLDVHCTSLTSPYARSKSKHIQSLPDRLHPHCDQSQSICFPAGRLYMVENIPMSKLSHHVHKSQAGSPCYFTKCSSLHFHVLPTELYFPILHWY